MIRVILFISIFICGGLIALALFLAGQSIPALIALVLAVIWIISVLRFWRVIPTFGLFGAYAMIVVGLRNGASSALLIPAAFLALLAWDLVDFSYRLRLAAHGDGVSRLIRRRLLVLSQVILVGAMMAAFSLAVHASLTFGWMAFMLLFAAWGIGRFVSSLLHRPHSR